MALHFPKHITEYKLAKDLFTRGKDIILSSGAKTLKEFTQHGTTSVFEHCVSVAKFSLLFAYAIERRFPGFEIDKTSLVRGALLHDYFLYDWHDPDPSHRLHGFTHPGTALKNAQRDYELNDIEKDIISKHMFPLTVVPPRYRESVIVCLADKWCALCETFKIDVSAYLIYRVNYHIALENGELTIRHGSDEVEQIPA